MPGWARGSSRSKGGQTIPEEKRSILVVDDDVQLVESVTTLLESVGYEVFSAYRAEAGLDLAREKQPDLILLDVLEKSEE
ncbi:MAG: response regulator [Anaerolineae bacterium]